MHDAQLYHPTKDALMLVDAAMRLLCTAGKYLEKKKEEHCMLAGPRPG